MNPSTPLRAIRARCLDCSDTTPDVKGCLCPECALYPYRMSRLPETGRRSPLRAIRAFCLDCCDGSSGEITVCEPQDCPLRVYRFGKNPALAGRVGCPGRPFQRRETHATAASGAPGGLEVSGAGFEAGRAASPTQQAIPGASEAITAGTMAD